MTPNDAENPHNEAAMDKSAGQDLQSLFAEGIACIATQKCDLGAECALSVESNRSVYARIMNVAK